MTPNGTEQLSNTIKAIEAFESAVDAINSGDKLTHEEKYTLRNASVEIAKGLFTDFEVVGRHPIQEIAEILWAMCQHLIREEDRE